jgi:hypothetical protein
MAIEIEIDLLDKETFICWGCKKEFKAVDGTWPRQRHDGTMIYTWDSDSDANDDSMGWCQDNFYCYDCVDKSVTV